MSGCGGGKRSYSCLVLAWKVCYGKEWTSMGLESSHGAGGKESSEGRDNRFLNLST